VEGIDVQRVVLEYFKKKKKNDRKKA
jgi:hypothetical protein